MSSYHDDLKQMRKEAKADKLAEYKERMCLKCHTMFMSLWCGNRICNKCKTHSEFHFDPGEYSTASSNGKVPDGSTN